MKVEVAPATPSSDRCRDAIDGNPRAGLEACGSHELFPLGSVGSTSLAFQLIDGNVRELVTKSFPQELAVLVQEF